MTDYIELQVTDDGVIETEVSEQIVIGGAASLQTKSVSYTPTESAQSAHLTPSTGYDGFSSVDVNVGAISSSYVGSGVTRRTSSDLEKNGATITAPAGYYESSASKSVTSGTAGTPTASKGAVSNHAIAVTPSVTNQSGYITGSTITGTAVSVSASELVSGTKSITSNGTGIDVTNYAAVDVAVPSGTPTLQNKTIHPSSSDQSITADNGYDGLGTVTVKGVLLTNLTAANIVSGVTVKVGDADDDDRVASVTGTASGGGGVKSGTFVVASDTTILRNGTSLDIGLTSAPDVLIVWIDAASYHALSSPSNNRCYMFQLYKYNSNQPPMRVNNTTSVSDIYSNIEYVRVCNLNVLTCSSDSTGVALTGAAVSAANAEYTTINSDGTLLLSSTSTSNQVMYAGTYHYVAITGATFPVY